MILNNNIITQIKEGEHRVLIVITKYAKKNTRYTILNKL